MNQDDHFQPRTTLTSCEHLLMFVGADSGELTPVVMELDRISHDDEMKNEKPCEYELWGSGIVQEPVLEHCAEYLAN